MGDVGHPDDADGGVALLLVRHAEQERDGTTVS